MGGSLRTTASDCERRPSVERRPASPGRQGDAVRVGRAPVGGAHRFPWRCTGGGVCLVVGTGFESLRDESASLVVSLTLGKGRLAATGCRGVHADARDACRRQGVAARSHRSHGGHPRVVVDHHERERLIGLATSATMAQESGFPATGARRRWALPRIRRLHSQALPRAVSSATRRQASRRWSSSLPWPPSSSRGLQTCCATPDFAAPAELSRSGSHNSRN
jgi:hypothetical protein